jgi:hypothetical protein
VTNTSNRENEKCRAVEKGKAEAKVREAEKEKGKANNMPVLAKG